jgi:hypothetical protein
MQEGLLALKLGCFGVLESQHLWHLAADSIQLFVRRFVRSAVKAARRAAPRAARPAGRASRPKRAVLMRGGPPPHAG